MFDFVRKHKRLLQFVLALMIVPPFAFWGIDSYQRMSSAVIDVAEVGDQKITENEFSSQLRVQQERISALLGRGVDASMLDTPEARSEVLEGMIQQRLLTQYVVRRRLSVTDDGLREVIASTPAFQENGKFSRRRYEDALRAEGYTPAQFEISLKRDLLVQQLAAAVNDSGIASRTVARAWALLAGERREIAQAKVPAGAFISQLKITQEAVQAFYESNRERFEVPEQVRVEYVSLTADALLAVEPVTAEEIRAQYEARRAQFEQKEERQAGHILISIKPGASEAEKAKAKAKAEGLLAEVRKSPSSFAALAKKHSEDPGSSEKGGDLGFFSRGMMAKPFEDAVFQMKTNEIAGPVESDFGYHIIRLSAVKSGRLRPLEEVRADIEKELRKQRAGRKFAEAAELFSNIVYEQPDSLKPVAERFKLQVQDGGWTTRGRAGVAALNNPRVLSALFSDDAIKNRRNTEAVEVAAGTMIAARVADHKPAVIRPLEEVRAEVVKQLMQREAAALAWKRGTDALDQLRKGKTAAIGFGAPGTVGREGTKDFPQQAVSAAFRLGREKLPAYAGVELPDGYLILRVTKVIPPVLDETKERSAQTELGRALGAREFRAYVAGLRADTKVVINPKALEKKPQ